jgi:hypothetical protein
VAGVLARLLNLAKVWHFKLKLVTQTAGEDARPTERESSQTLQMQDGYAAATGLPYVEMPEGDQSAKLTGWPIRCQICDR